MLTLVGLPFYSQLGKTFNHPAALTVDARCLFATIANGAREIVLSGTFTPGALSLTPHFHAVAFSTARTARVLAPSSALLATVVSLPITSVTSLDVSSRRDLQALRAVLEEGG